MSKATLSSRARRLAGRALRRVERRVGHEIVPRDRLSRVKTTPPSAARPPASVPSDSKPKGSAHDQIVQPEGVWSGQPRTALRAIVLADDRFAELLAPEWHQVRPDSEGATISTADLLLVQLEGDGAPGWSSRHTASVVASAVTAGLPVVAWATAPAQAPDWLTDCAAVLASDDSAAESLTTAGALVTRVAPFAQPLTQGPAGLGAFNGRRKRRIGVVLDDGATFDSEPSADIFATAVELMQRRETTMVAAHERHSGLQVPGAFPDRVQSVGPWSHIGGTLGSVAVAMDLSGTTPKAAWTSMASAMHATPLVGVENLGGGLPAEVNALIPRVSTAFDLDIDLGARMRQRELGRREGHLLLRSVMRGHTAGDRVRVIGEAVGVPLPAIDRSVSAVVPTNRTHELDNVLANLGRQQDVDVELVLVFHGLQVNHAEVHARAAEAGVGRLVIVEAGPELTLGACMNLGVDASSGRYVAKMDDDNFYGPQFLADLVDSVAYSGAEITGKWCHYVWLSSSRAVVLRFREYEHRFGNRVQGGSMLFEGDVVRSLRFSDIPRQVDTDILDRAHAQGIGIYSADPWNYVSIRGSDRHSHTWTVPDGVFLNGSGDLRFFGDPTEHVTL